MSVRVVESDFGGRNFNHPLSDALQFPYIISWRVEPYSQTSKPGVL
jgi:hypothetical protein